MALAAAQKKELPHLTWLCCPLYIIYLTILWPTNRGCHHLRHFLRDPHCSSRCVGQVTPVETPLPQSQNPLLPATLTAPLPWSRGPVTIELQSWVSTGDLQPIWLILLVPNWWIKKHCCVLSLYSFTRRSFLQHVFRCPPASVIKSDMCSSRHWWPQYKIHTFKNLLYISPEDGSRPVATLKPLFLSFHVVLIYVRQIDFGKNLLIFLCSL